MLYPKSPPNILVVDDTLANLMLMRRLLTQAGYRVMIAKNAKETFDQVKEASPDLIVLDVVLPDMNGFEICKHLKANLATRDIPVIFMTALSSVEDKMKGFQVGGVDYVTKPIQPVEMQARVNAHLKLRAMQAALEAQNAELSRYREHLEQRVEERTAALCESNRHLSLTSRALNQVGEGVFLSDLDGRFLYVNEEACRSLGYSEEELLQLSVTDIDPDWSQEMLPSIRDIQQRGNPPPSETWHRRKDSSLFPVNTVASLFEYEGKTYYLSVARDATAHKLAEEQNREHLHFVETMNKVNQAIQGTKKIKQMASEVFDIALAALDCDKASLISPTDASGEQWIVLMARHRPGFSYPFELGTALPYTPETKRALLDLMKAEGVVKLGEGTDKAYPPGVAEQFGLRTSMVLSIHPWTGSPWSIFVHRCAEARGWTLLEERLFLEIGRRLTDGISAIFAYRELQNSELQYRTLAESLPDCISRFDKQARLLYANAAQMTRLTTQGMDASKARGRTLIEAFDSANVYALHSWIEQVIATSIPIEQELKLADVHGKCARVYLIKIVPDQGPDGGTVGALMIGRDITERVANEQIISQLNADWAATLQTIPDLLFEFDAQGTYLQIWTHKPELLAAPKAQMLGRRVTEVLPAEAATTAMAALQEAETEGASYGHTIILSLADGPHWFEFSVARKQGAPGMASRFITLSRDISKRVQAEMQLKESRAQLRSLATRREAAREDERKKIARELHDELGQQLTALRFGLSLLDYKFGSNLPELHDTTADLLTLLEKTVQTVCNVSSSLRPAALDMGVVAALEWLLAEYSQQTNIPCELKAPESDVAISEDIAIVVFRIVQESLTNAARHAKADHIQVKLYQDENDLRVEVCDNGVGFDLELGVRHRSYGLVGIRERAIAVGGEAVISSAPGQGTTVRVCIPLKNNMEDAT
ncbi:MAG TPA: PAS domain S-box protein [Rhodocyclaceae bacterium]|nr:PAS domain S-box protein [Rhodocyclaceae bacterium]